MPWSALASARTKPGSVNSELALLDRHHRRARKEIDGEQRARAARAKEQRGAPVRQQAGILDARAAKGTLELLGETADEDPVG